MVWNLAGSIVITEDFQTSLPFDVFSSPYYKFDFLTQFPSRHRLLIGTSSDSSLQETTTVQLFYPSPYPVVVSPQLPAIWNGEFCFFVRSLRWGNTLPPLTLNLHFYSP